MPPAATTRRRTTKAKPAPEPEDLEELTDDADMPDDDDLEEEAPAPKRRTSAKVPAQRKAAAAEAETFGTAWLVEHVNDTLDTEYDAKTMRVKLRAITAAGILDREDSSRYTFTGPTDRNVLKILKWLRENAKAESAEASKPATATRKAAAPAAKRGRPRKAAPVEEDDDLGDDIDDL